MILQQNYIKIVEYTQKAFKIFCRRSLGNAIIKNLHRNNAREKERSQEDNQLGSTLANHHRKLGSEDIGFSGLGQRELSLEQDSAKSEDKRTQNKEEKYGGGDRKQGMKDKLQIFYGDLVYIEYGINETQNLRAKYFLNKLKFCNSDDIGQQLSSDLRCIFEIVYPSQSLQPQKRGTLLTESSLISFRTISKSEYLRVKNSKIVYSDEFGKELELSKHLNQCCVFELKYGKSSLTEEAIISGEEICFKFFDQMLYLNVLGEEREAFFSQTPAYFTLEKISKRPENFVPVYYRMKSNKFLASISGNPIELQGISQKKTMMNVIAINEKNMENKINPINFTQFDFSKIPEQDPKISNANTKDPSVNMLNCWQFIQVPGRLQSNLCQLYNPVIGLGLSLKSGKGLIKLTANRKDFATLKLVHHDEDIISFTFEANLQELDIIYDGQNSDKFLMVLSKPEAQNQSKKIKIKHINSKTAYMICEMTEILDVLKAVYQFLDTWGNEVDEKLETMFYSVKEIKLGSSMMLKKVRQMKIVIKILKTYLQNPQNSTQQIQNTINSMKILQMIINICKVITNKIGNIYPFLQNDPESPFCFAKNNLEEILISLFSVLLKLTKDNIANSNVVISEVDFFNQILIYYPEQIGEILQESIKNLSVFTTKNNNQSGASELFLWVKLIEPVREQTIRIQKTYIDIIAQVVVDPSDHGIPIYQNRCKQLLFIQNSKRKCIPKFGIDPKQNKPIIIFQNESMMSDFLSKNHHLSKLNLVHLNSASYFIEDFYADRYTPQADISQQYVGYIGSIVNMFRNLCRNRNKKLFKVVDDWGINEEHIQLVFASKKIDWSLKANYLSLWSAIFIDEDPFLPFEKRESKCHYWPKIQNYNLQDCTALIFKQYTDQTLAISKLNEVTLKMYPILSSYFFYLKKKLPNAYTELPELRTLLTVLNTVHEIINLGYMTLKSMKDCIGVVLGLLAGLDEIVVGKRNGELEIQKYYFSILERLVDILALYEDIWVEVYGIQFLVDFYRESQSRSYCLEWDKLEQRWQNILTTTFPETQQPPHKPYQRKRTRHNVFSQNQTSLTSPSPSPSIEYFILQTPLTFPQVQTEINNFLIKLLTHRILEVKCESYQKIVKLLENKGKRRERVCGYLREIMLLTSEGEELIYNNFSGRESNKLLNWLKIQQIVHKITQIETNNNNDQLEQRIKREKILQLNNIVVKILREMKNYRSQDRNLFVKCQMILQKLGVHGILLQLLRYGDKPVYKDFIHSVLDFISQFLHNNENNTKTLIPHLDKFTRNLSHQPVTQIIPQIIKASKSSELAYKITQELIYKINATEMTVHLIVILERLMGVCRGSVYGQLIGNGLARRVLEVWGGQGRDRDRDKEREGEKVMRSFQFVKMLCRLAGENGELCRKLKACYPKCTLLETLKRSSSYSQKKTHLKILIQLYIRNKPLQTFQIEDYLQILILPQLKKLPQLTTKLLQKPTATSTPTPALEKSPQLHNLYVELLTYENVKIETRDEESYYHYVLDFWDTGEVSVLGFAGLLVARLRGSGGRLVEVAGYLRKLEMFLLLVFYQASSSYHHTIFQQLQSINLQLQCTLPQPSPPQPLPLTQPQKQQIKQFYHSLASIIIEQKISLHRIFTCFNIDQAKLEMKRLNFGVCQFVSERHFVGCLGVLGESVVKGVDYGRLVGGVRVFRFVNLSKDSRNKQIDLYSFMEKLVRLLQHTKTKQIKQQIDLLTEPQPQQDALPGSEREPHSLHSCPHNPLIKEQQFTLQVRNFCSIAEDEGEKLSQAVMGNLEGKLKEAVFGLTRELIADWANHPSFNVFALCQYYRCELLYGLMEAVLMRYGDGDFNAKSVSQFAKVLEARFNQSPNPKILLTLQQLLTKLSPNPQILQKLQKLHQKVHSKLFLNLSSTKSQHNLILLSAYRPLFTEILNNPYIDEEYKLKTKVRFCENVRKVVGRGVQFGDGYDGGVMGVLLGVWGESQCWEVGGGWGLAGVLVGWLEQLLDKKSLKQITSSSSKNINRCKFALLTTKTLTKLHETHSPSLHPIQQQLPLKLPKIQQAANILFREHIAPKNQSHIKEEYCLGLSECSEFFCNYSRLSVLDQNIMELILGLFVLVRLQAGSWGHPGAIGEGKGIQDETEELDRMKQVDQKFDSMLGSIRYRLYGRQNNFNFKLPACRLFNNTDVEQSIISQLSQLPEQKIHSHLHPLSKVFLCKLSTLSFIHSHLPMLKHIFIYKRLIKKLLLVLLLLITLLQANSPAMFSQIEGNLYFDHPIIKITCIFSLFINFLYLGQEFKVFLVKCQWYYPVKYADQGEAKLGKFDARDSSVEIRNVAKSVLETGNTELEDSFNGSNKNTIIQRPVLSKPKQTSKQPQKPLSCFQLVRECLTSLILLRFLLILAYIATMVNKSFLVFCLLLKGLDIETSRVFLMALCKIVFKLLFVLVFNLIYLIFAFVFFCYEQQAVGQPQTITQLQMAFLKIWYQSTFLLQPPAAGPLAPILALQQIFSLVTVLILIFYISNSLYQIEKDKKNREDKCWICLKSRREVEARGQGFQRHINVQHRVWDYLYFFIEWDRKGKMEGLDGLVADQIAMRDYKFIKLY